MYKPGFRKGRGTRHQIVNIHWIIEKARTFQKNIYLCFIDYMEAFGCGIHNKLWKILKEMGLPDHLPCLLRNMYDSQEATVRTRHGKTILKDTEQEIFVLGRKAMTNLDSILKLLSQ